MQPPPFLVGKHPQQGILWAAIDPNVRYLEPRITETRFAAYLAPFTDVEAARQALIAAGATNIEAEQRKRRGAR
jgi:hypothetical protein